MKKVVKQTKKEKIFKTSVQETDEQSPEDEKDLEVEKNEILQDLENKMNDSEEESECAEEIEQDKKTGKKRKPKEKLSEEEKPKRKKKEKKPLLDPDFNLERDYFYQTLSAQEKEELKKQIENFFTADQEIDLKGIFNNYSNLSKSQENINFVQNMYTKLLI
jgi:hypothetical protein